MNKEYIYTGELSDADCNKLIDQYMRESDIVQWDKLDQNIKDRLCQEKWEEERAYWEHVRHDRIE